MNTPIPPDDPAFDASEWNAQEQALRAERLGLDNVGDDARTAAYRRIARALRQPPPDPLPADFAAHVAARARADAAHEGLERTLGGLLLAILVAAGIGYGMDGPIGWWPAVHGASALRWLASPWLLSLAACAGLTALLQVMPLARTRGKPRA